MLAHTQKITGFQKFHLKKQKTKKQKTEETIKSTKQLSTWN